MKLTRHFCGFSEALEKMKSGTPMTREGWNGRKTSGFKMFITKYTPAQQDQVLSADENQDELPLPKDVDGAKVRFRECLMIFVVNKEGMGSASPYLPSNIDIFSDDWEEYEGYSK